MEEKKTKLRMREDPKNKLGLKREAGSKTHLLHR